MTFRTWLTSFVAAFFAVGMAHYAASFEAPARRAPSSVEAPAGPSCATLNLQWPKYRDYFKIAFDVEKFDCPSPMSKLAETFFFLETVRWLPRDGGQPPEYYHWLAKVVSRIEFHDDCKANAIAHWPRKNLLSICPPFFDRPIFQRAAVLIHEARHLQGSYPHVKCERGEDLGNDNCDPVFAIDGTGHAYSYGFGFMLWVLNGSDYPADEKPRIRELLDWELSNRYNDLTDAQVTELRARLLGIR